MACPLYQSLRARLSQRFLERTLSPTTDNAPKITLPSLVIENGADDATPPAHPRQIYSLFGSVDKTFSKIDGASHYYLNLDDKKQIAIDLLADWLNVRGFIDYRHINIK